jgi:hypothetical protein
VATDDLDDQPTFNVEEGSMDAGHIFSTTGFEGDSYQVIEDDDEEVGAIPLGTSDLVIDEKLLYAIVERCNNGDGGREEDEEVDRGNLEEISHTETTRDDDISVIHGKQVETSNIVICSFIYVTFRSADENTRGSTRNVIYGRGQILSR